ncbi:glycosyltransferase family 4 protein [Stieleria sp. ICT_E10.1]|uniref:glycosyltransferase family 4 protein n=1 Tax=Stieleria sedimenti TaxID=2976331 RepID=UPI00218033BE|nr:glycosyltransferase family 1 protein [Stieleria sedimenti]MCS7470847.1 glycosyltransferase family 4 protein [Stieleria sedimenti]
MAKPQVLIDGTVFEGRGRIGVWRLFYELLSRTANEVDYTLLVGASPQQDIPIGVSVARFIRGPELVSRRHVVWRMIRPALHGRLRSRFPNHIWHPTFFSLDPRGRAVGSDHPKRLATVYDMLSEDFYWMGDFALQREMKQRCVEQSDHVLTISHDAAERLTRYFPAMRGRVTVMHLAADHRGQLTSSPAGVPESPDDSDAARHSNGAALPPRYCLFVGGRNLYKNFPTVVRALATGEWPDDLPLVVVGASFDAAEQAFIRSHGVADRIVSLGAVDDNRLCECYRQSSCFVFPSLGEGFGLPVLEAQSHGTIPVLCDTEVFREVAGEAAIFHPPNDPTGLARAVRAAIERPEQVDPAAMQTNLQRFSWDRAAATLVETYESLWRDAAP